MQIVLELSLHTKSKCYKIAFRWFVGLNLDDVVWHPTTFIKNRDRLLEWDIARACFDGVVALAKARNLISDEHFTIDGTLIESMGRADDVRA